MSNVVDDLLNDIPDDARPRRKNLIADRRPALGDAIKRFLELKAAGDERARGLTLRWFYNNKLRDRFDGPGMDTVRAYVRDWLGLDLDGKPIDE